MSEQSRDGLAFLKAVEQATEYEHFTADVEAALVAFNAGIQHVRDLLADAITSFGRRSFGTSVFLALTALEETAKIDILMFRINRDPINHQKGRDPLRDHRSKHLLAVSPTAFMGRLPGLLGTETCARLKCESENGTFAELRERSLYFHWGKTGWSTPATAITRNRAREILLLALEMADDRLVGRTSESWELSDLIEKWISALVDENEASP